MMKSIRPISVAYARPYALMSMLSIMPMRWSWWMAMTTGRIDGNMMLQKLRHGLAPSMRLASMISVETD